MSRTIVSLWFPTFAIDRWNRIAARPGETENTSRPVVLVTETAHGPVIDAVSPEAGEAGARAGMRLADARMLAPQLLAVPSDHEGNQRGLEKLAAAAQRWGPWSMVDGGDAVLLDASGSAHLFGGEAAMLAGIEARFASQGYHCRAASAPNGGAAWALSHYGMHRAVVNLEADLPAVLAPLPVASLRLNADTGLLLVRLGLKTIGELMAVPRDSLARRFRNRRSAEANPLTRLDQMLGRAHEPLVPLVERLSFAAERRLAEPVLHLDLLKRVVGDLAIDLARRLENDKQGARRLVLRLWRVDGDHTSRTLELASPSRNPGHIMRLFEERLEGIDAGFGIDQARLIATWAEPLGCVQDTLDTPDKPGTSLPVLVDRLVTRLGRDRVTRLRPCKSHWPELSQQAAPPDRVPPLVQCDPGFSQRPLKLLARPEPIAVIYATPEGLPRRFRWRGGLYVIAKAEGPERIAPEWWRQRANARLRDYYRIEDETGRRYWIYRYGLIEDGRGGPPDWYMHGFFA
ncbi:DUF6504 family protein [Qipengyuania huizhouensis]|uniref:DUF6504 family protein n=1 Tax=Qipengyuania huizhouensis TaxID=2867245 RepID=UPI001C87DAB4|nr:DUF6504 family protein [Qipengyuania huizhouensis]MBX7459708.1 DNA polymerase Y family protein [Qipengyuania huizhouensis]